MGRNILFALKSLALLQFTSSTHIQPRKLRVLGCAEPRQKLNRCEYSWARSATTVLTGILAFFSFNPALAQNTIPQLLQNLLRYAQQGNYQQFMSNTTLQTQELSIALSKAKEKLHAQQTQFFYALDCQFGKKPSLTVPFPQDPRDALFKLVDLRLISATPVNSSTQSLRLETQSGNTNKRIITEQNTFMAVQSGNEWKLDLSIPIKCATKTINQRTKITRTITQQVFQGKFKNRTEALNALTQGLNERPHTQGTVQ